jgi:hypothetical protein
MATPFPNAINGFPMQWIKLFQHHPGAFVDIAASERHD